MTEAPASPSPGLRALVFYTVIDLCAAADHNVETAVEHFGRYGDGAVSTRRPGTLLVASRTDFAGAFHNTALRVIPDTAPSRVLDEARAFGAAHDRPVVLWAAAHRDQDLAKEARANGFELRSTAPGMGLHTPPPKRAVPADVELVPVTDHAGSEAFAAVHRDVFITSGRPAEAVNHFASPDALLAQNVAAVVARVNGAPASCAMIIHSGTTAGIYWVATTPTARNRGLGTLVTATIARLAFEHGTIEYEVVSALRLDVPGRQRRLRKVLGVVRDDQLGVSLDRCGENVPVVGVGQVDDLDERLVVHDQHIPDRLVHQFPGAVQLDRVQVGTIELEVAKVSSRIRSVHFAWTRPAWATRISRSRRLPGQRTLAS